MLYIVFFVIYFLLNIVCNIIVLCKMSLMIYFTFHIVTKICYAKDMNLFKGGNAMRL